MCLYFFKVKKFNWTQFKLILKQNGLKHVSWWYFVICQGFCSDFQRYWHKIRLNFQAIEYEDGTPATQSQLSKDVATFLVWAASPEQDVRKKLFIKVNNNFIQRSSPVDKHGRPQNSFLGWANYIMDRAKGYYHTFHYQILIQISYFVSKISQMSYSCTEQVPSIAHWCGCHVDKLNLVMVVRF